MAYATRRTEPRLDLRERQDERSGIVLGGVFSGVFAGIVMALFATTASWALGNGFWTPVKEIACVAYGVDALVAGASAILAGVLIHLTIASCWGMLFAALLPRGSGAWTALWTGVLYSIGVWALMTYGVLPWGNEVQSARAGMMPDWFFYSHLVYGASLLVTPAFRRRFYAGAGAAYQRGTQPRARVPV
ncbi:MAG: hypothetical protein HY554_13055 [Elusimicrobia bacterium]|nr:hypothetical protein [Elusimicrobiota bacterium]